MLIISWGKGPLYWRKQIFLNVPQKGGRQDLKVLESHHPRGTTLREAIRGNLPLRGVSGPLRGSLRGFCGVSAVLCGVRGALPRVVTSDPGELLDKRG